MRSTRATLLAIFVPLLVGLVALAWALVVPALEVRDFERDVVRRLSPVVSCSGADACSAEATATRVSSFRAEFAADDDVSDRLEPLHRAYVEQFEAEETFWREVAAREDRAASTGSTEHTDTRAMVAAAKRTRAVARDVGGPLYPLVS